MEPAPQHFPSLEAAHHAALVDALARAAMDKKEWGGACFQRGDTFYCTLPLSSGDGYNIEVKAKRGEPGDVLVSTYHVHPSGPNSTVFSPADVTEARKLKVPTVIGLAESNAARIFDPATDKPMQVSARDRRNPLAGAARGREYLSRQQMLASALERSAP